MTPGIVWEYSRIKQRLPRLEALTGRRNKRELLHRACRGDKLILEASVIVKMGDMIHRVREYSRIRQKLGFNPSDGYLDKIGYYRCKVFVTDKMRTKIVQKEVLRSKRAITKKSERIMHLRVHGDSPLSMANIMFKSK